MTDLAGWIGRAREVEDEVTAPALRRLAALLDRPPPDRAAPVPPHWLAILFDDAQPQSQLGADGHPRKGEFLPPVALPRRMLAGRRVAFHGPAFVGDALTRRSEITAITPKEGRSGRLVFVTVTHRIAGPRGPVAEEVQDIAYREAAAPGAAPPAAPDPPPPADWKTPVLPDPVLLFRYSALTFNGHRIHYDADYARAAEGYPGLVVNGGLSTLLLLEAFGRPLAGYAVRTLRPLFCGRPAWLCGAGDLLWIEDDSGAMALRIEARAA